ncbi:hypothetical protein WA158_001996 [Blastocystis sp. Blastoise]
MEVEQDNELPTLEIKEWNAIAVWSYNSELDTCAICRSKLMGQCLECQSKPAGTYENDGDECKIVWGKCGHGFHQHCINRWLKVHQNCPIDMTTWEQAAQEKL